MLVTIQQIRGKGLILDEAVGVDLVAAALDQQGRATGFKATSGFNLHAELHKISGGVLLRATFKAEVAAPCKRCLAEVPVPLPVDFTMNLVPEDVVRHDVLGEADDDEKGETVGSFTLEDANEEIFDGRTIDLDPILREQVLLALPMNVVCREDCKGLCPTCGKDLNAGPCTCEPRAVDPRLAVLKNIKLH